MTGREGGLMRGDAAETTDVGFVESHESAEVEFSVQSGYVRFHPRSPPMFDTT